MVTARRCCNSVRSTRNRWLKRLLWVSWAWSWKYAGLFSSLIRHHAIDIFFSRYIKVGVYQFSKNLVATSKLQAPEGRHRFDTEDPIILGTTVCNWSPRQPGALDLCTPTLSRWITKGNCRQKTNSATNHGCCCSCAEQSCGHTKGNKFCREKSKTVHINAGSHFEEQHMQLIKWNW